MSENVKTGIAVLILGGLVGAYIVSGYHSPPNAPQLISARPAAPPAAPVAQPAPRRSITIDVPQDEMSLVNIAKDARAQYRAAPNEMAAGGVRAERARQLCAAMPSANVRNWAGKVYKLTSTSDGKGVLELELDDGIYVTTWNNGISDIGDHTLIEPGTSLFTAASSLKEGDWVRFSGRLATSQTDCLYEPSMTLDGSMTEPEFLIRFSDIQPIRLQ